MWVCALQGGEGQLTLRFRRLEALPAAYTDCPLALPCVRRSAACENDAALGRFALDILAVAIRVGEQLHAIASEVRLRSRAIALHLLQLARLAELNVFPADWPDQLLGDRGVRVLYGGSTSIGSLR